jgi:hypothetical protein
VDDCPLPTINFLTAHLPARELYVFVPTMRPKLHRCPNQKGCLLAYRGEDVEVFREMAPICPECGTILEKKRTPRTSLIPTLVSTTVIAALVAGAWILWPHVVRWWNYITTPR